MYVFVSHLNRRFPMFEAFLVFCVKRDYWALSDVLYCAVYRAVVGRYFKNFLYVA